MSNIFLDQEQLDERINSLLTRKNKTHNGEPQKRARFSISIDRMTNSATINR